MILLETGTVLYMKQVHWFLNRCLSFTRFDSFKLRPRLKELKWRGFF